MEIWSRSHFFSKLNLLEVSHNRMIAISSFCYGHFYPKFAEVEMFVRFEVPTALNEQLITKMGFKANEHFKLIGNRVEMFIS